MSPEQQKDKFSPEMRILVASLLSMVVILGWVKFFALLEELKCWKIEMLQGCGVLEENFKLKWSI